MRNGGLRVDWGAVIEQLQASGRSLREVAADVGVSEGALRKARFGDVRYGTGERLVLVWVEVTGQDPEELPRTDGLQAEA